VFEEATEQVFTEALGAAASGGLELKLAFNENGELPYDTLLPYASNPTQQRFNETRQNAQQLLEVMDILVKRHNDFIGAHSP